MEVYERNIAEDFNGPKISWSPDFMSGTVVDEGLESVLSVEPLT